MEQKKKFKQACDQPDQLIRDSIELINQKVYI